jgi:hypothetical protein
LKLERLESRCLLASASLVGSELQLIFDSANEEVTLSSSASSIAVSVVGGGSLGNFSPANVQRIVASDPGGLSGQRLNISGNVGFVLSGGFQSSDVEMVLINNGISATGTSGIDIVAPWYVQTTRAIQGGDNGVRLVGLGHPTLGNSGVSSSAAIRAEGSGAIEIDGTAGLGDFFAVGVSLTGEVTTAAGAIEIRGQGSIHPSGLFNSGIEINSTVRSGGNATVLLTGNGGGTDSNNNGVVVGSSGIVTSEGGNVTVIGTAGSGRDSSGVLVESGGRITSGGNGEVTVEGTGGTGVRSSEGITVRGTNSVITSGGSGEVRLNGTGGSGGAEYLGSTAIRHHGIRVTSSGLITSGGGDLRVTGVGGSGVGQFIHGIAIESAGQIVAGGSGNLFLDGTGGQVTSGPNYGVSGSGNVSSGGGNVNILGQTNPSSPTGQGSAGIFGSGYSAGGLGSLLMEGSASGPDSGVAITGASTSGGNLTIQATGSPISISGVAPGGLGSLLVQATGADVIATGTITSGGGNVALETSNGRMRVQGLITAGGNGNVRIDATGTDQGIILENFGRVSSLDGDVELIGRGNIGISVVATSGSAPTISAGGNGAVNLLGIGGTTGVLLGNSRTITSSGGLVRVEGSGSSRGVHVQLLGSINAPGEVQVVGTAGESNNSRGVLIESQGTVIAGQDLEVIGTAGTGASSGYGVLVTDTNSRIVGGAQGSTARIVGSGGSSSTATSQRGVSIESSGRIETNGSHLQIEGSIPNGQGIGVYMTGSNSRILASGSVQVVGSGGQSGNANYGVQFQSGQVTSEGSQTDIQGTAGLGSSAIGVYVGSALVGPNSAGTRITGNGGSGTSSFGVRLETGSITASSGLVEIEAKTQASSPALQVRPGGRIEAPVSSSVEIRADSLEITISGTPGQINAPSGTVFIAPMLPDVAINLGGADVLSGPSRVLGLSNAEFNRINAGSLVIGSSLSSGIVTSTSMVRSTAIDVQLRSSQDISVSNGSLETAGGSVLLAPGSSPFGVKPKSSGNEFTASTVGFASDLIIEINGTVPDVSYDRLSVAGTVDLTGVDLMTSGNFPGITGGETFEIVSATGIVGAFTGLPHLSPVVVQGLVFQISYSATSVQLVPASTTSSIQQTFVYHSGSSFAGQGIPAALDTAKSLAKAGPVPIGLNYNNLINSSRGINGLVFDFEGLPGNSLAASDFEFKMSPLGAFVEQDHPPAGWQSAPDPSSILVIPGSLDRVVIEWPENAIANRWLQITLQSNSNTGLAEPETFYVGHLLGETTGPNGGVYTVAFADITPIRSAVGQSVNSDSIHDIDKNGTVSFADISAMRANVGTQLTNITIPAASSMAPLYSSDPGDSGIKAPPFETRSGSLMADRTQLVNKTQEHSSLVLRSSSRLEQLPAEQFPMLGATRAVRLSDDPSDKPGEDSVIQSTLAVDMFFEHWE